MVPVEADRTKVILKDKFERQGLTVESHGAHNVSLRAVVQGTTPDDASHLLREALSQNGITTRRVSVISQGIPSDDGLQQVSFTIE